VNLRTNPTSVLRRLKSTTQVAVVRAGNNLELRRCKNVVFAVVVTMAGALLAPLPAAASPARPSGGTHTSVVANCLHLSRSVRYEPKRMVQACGGDAIFTMTRVSYLSWRARAASGHAVQRYDSCSPSCSAGNLIDRRVSFKLYHRVTWHHRHLFACMVVHGGEGGEYTLLNQRSISDCPSP
jgi:hypothetical protein